LGFRGWGKEPLLLRLRLTCMMIVRARACVCV